MLDLAGDGLTVEVGELYAVGRDDGEIAVAEKEQVARVIEDGGHVGGNEVFILAQTDYGGRTIARGDNFIGFVDRDDAQSEHAGKLFDGLPHGFFEWGTVAISSFQKVFLDEVGDDFGICFSGELVAFLNQLLLEGQVVLDDAVVDDDDCAGAVAVRMGVFFAGAAVSGPARVADAIAAFQRLLADNVFEIAQLAFGAADLKAVAVSGDRDARGVLTPILQPAQTFNDDRYNFFLADVADDAAHKPDSCSG